MNYLVIRDGERRLFEQGGGAGLGLDYHFAVGPAIVLRWLDNLADYAAEWWLAPESAHGGVVIDADEKVLLLSSTVYDRGERAVILAAYARTWPGWDIRWCSFADLMAYAGDEPAEASADAEASSPPVDPDSGTGLEAFAARVRFWWPVAEILSARGVDVASIRETNFAGVRPQLDLELTAEDMDAVVARILSP
ncbi:MAG TPA: hypothetical protein VGF17_18900 [Phytomonospora sp.]